MLEGAADDLAVGVDVGALGAGEELVPGAEERALAVGEERERPLDGEQLAQRLGSATAAATSGPSARREPDGVGALGVAQRRRGVEERLPVPALEVLRRPARSTSAPSANISSASMPAGHLDLGVVAPGLDRVAPAVDLEAPRRPRRRA